MMSNVVSTINHIAAHGGRIALDQRSKDFKAENETMNLYTSKISSLHGEE
jgi:hypothetical protein